MPSPKNRTIMIILPHPNWRMNWNSKIKSEMEFNGLKWLLPVVIGLMFSCGRTERPANVMSKPEMVKTFMEVYVAEEKVNRLSVPRDSSVIVFDSLRARIFDKLEVEDSVFKKSLLWYTEHPQDMQDILSALVDSLQLREQKTPGQPAP
jgi:hypothetical protein